MPHKILTALNAAAEAKAWPVYLFGGPGRGKSCAAACAFASWPGSAVWLSLSLLCDELNRFMTQPHITVYSNGVAVELSKSGYWRRLQTSQLVVVDEIGTREATGHRFETLLTLLELRRCQPLIMTGNLSLNGLEQAYDERISSRICAGTIIEFTGEDRRLNGLPSRAFRA